MKRPWSSGFCAPRMPDDSHRRCHGAYRDLPCSCSCHDESEEPDFLVDQPDDFSYQSIYEWQSVPPPHCPTCTCKETA